MYFHVLGTPTGSDTYVLGREFPRIAETELDASPDGKYVLALVKKGGYLEPAQIGEVEKFLHAPAQWSAAHGGVSTFPSS